MPQLSLMSGNLDDLPASDDTFRETADRIVRGILNDNTQSPHDISPSGELYRAIDRYHRTRGVGSRLGSETRPHTMASEPDPDRRRRIQREVQDVSPLFVLQAQSPTVPPPQRDRPVGRAAGVVAGHARRGGRSRMSISDRFNERHRPTLQERAASNSLEHAGRQLEQARALLDDPVPNLSLSVLDPEYRDITDQDRRAKRRKLDSDRPDGSFKGFSYGQYGQVEPGKLKMEIVSCDGGIFQDHSGNYAAENVLQNDASVYCTKSPRCNLVLRHQGSTVFCLEELIIKAPHAGYTAPLQEGMVFVSMTSDDLLTRTAQYQIQYSPPRQRRTAAQRANELPPILSIQHHDDGIMTTAQARARRLYEIGQQDEECDYRMAQIPADFTANAQPFNITATCSDSEGDEEDTVQALRHRTLHRAAGLRYEDSDSSEEDNPEQSGLWHDDYLLGLGQSSALLRRRETASNITLAQAAEASQIATQEAVQAVGELMAPLARFFIERDKSKCTLRFDPPVSGRFILLKLWSPHHSSSSNIDIQYVVAKGFAGPRYFPAINLR